MDSGAVLEAEDLVAEIQPRSNDLQVLVRVIAALDLD
jgi:hypothetical protein